MPEWPLRPANILDLSIPTTGANRRFSREYTVKRKQTMPMWCFWGIGRVTTRTGRFSANTRRRCRLA